MRRNNLVVVLGLAFVATAPAAARADWFTDETPPANAKPLSEIIRSLEDQGYKPITEVEFDDGKWSIEAHPADKEVNLKVDAVTGQIAGR